MSFRPPAQSPTPTRHTLRQVLAAGVATETNGSKTSRWDDAYAAARSVFENDDLFDLLSLKLIGNLFETGSVKDLCRDLTNWCETKRLACDERVFEVACKALGVDTMEKATRVVEGVRSKASGLSISKLDTIPVLEENIFWRNMFVTLCRIRNADKAGILSADWGKLLQGNATPEGWMQLLLKCLHGYSGNDAFDVLPRALQFVCRINLPPTQEGSVAFFDEYIARLLPLHTALLGEDHNEAIRIIEENNLTAASMVVMEEEGSTEDNQMFKFMELDHLVLGFCHDIQVDVGRLVANPVLVHLLKDPDYNPVQLSLDDPVPPVIAMAAYIHLLQRNTFKSFQARLQHERIHLALEFVTKQGPGSLDGGHNILTALFAWPFEILSTPDTLDQVSLQLYYRHEALREIETALLPQNRGLLKTLLTHKNRNGLTALNMFNQRMGEWRRNQTLSYKLKLLDDPARDSFNQEIVTYERGILDILNDPTLL